MNIPVKKSHSRKPKALGWLLAGVILATLVAVIAVFVGYRRMAVDPEDADEMLKRTGAEIALKKIRHTATRNGRDEWTLTAKSARVMEDHNRTVIDSPSVVFYMEDGKKVYLTAKQGILEPKTNDLEAIGDVTVNYEIYILKTQRLYYDHQKRRIYSKVPVTIEGDRIFLAADRMVYDLDTQTSTFKGNIESRIHERFVL